MTGKKSDQFQSDPGEDMQDEKLRVADKQHVAQTKKHDHESFIPKAGKNPALADLQAKREQKEEENTATEENGEA